MTIINFLLSSLSIGTQVVALTTRIRRALILDIENPPPENPQLVNNIFQNLTIAYLWSLNLPVSSNLLLLDPVSFHPRCRYYSVISLSFGGLGPSSKVDSGYSLYRSCCGLEPWVNIHFAGSCSLLLNPYTPCRADLEQPYIDMPPSSLPLFWIK